MSETKDPPRLPDVVDEAGATPAWVPWLGLALLCVFALLIAARQLTGGDSLTDQDDSAQEAGEAGATD